MNHGKDCETYKTAETYTKVLEELGDSPEGDGPDRDAWEEQRETEDDEFLKDILEDYSIILQKEYEYRYSDEYINETASANDYQFDEKGRIV